MRSRYLLTTSDQAMKHVENPCFKENKEVKWVYKSDNANTADETLLDQITKDVRRGLVKIDDEAIWVTNSDDSNDTTTTKKLDDDKTEVTITDQSQSIVRTVGHYFDNANEFKKHLISKFKQENVAKLLQHYNQSFSSDVVDAINQALIDLELFVTDKSCHTNCYADSKGNIHLSIYTSNIKIADVNGMGKGPNGSNPTEKALPGKVTIKYVLTDNGFKLESFAPSNSILRDICLLSKDGIQSKMPNLATIINGGKPRNNPRPQYKQINDNVIAFADAEENLWSAIEDENNNAILKKHAITVLDEVIKEREHTAEDKKLNELTKILTMTTYTVKHPEDTVAISNYTQSASQFKKKHSWGKMIGGAMLAFAGAAVVVASTLIALKTFGIASPISYFGIKLGKSLFVKGGAIVAGALGAGAEVGGVFLFRSGLSRGSLFSSMNKLSKQASKTDVKDEKQISNEKKSLSGLGN